AAYLRMSSVILIEQKCDPAHGTSSFANFPSSLKSHDVATAGQGIARRKVMGRAAVSLPTMTDSLHSHNSNPRKSLRLTRSPSSRSAGARHNNGLRSGRHRTLLAND